MSEASPELGMVLGNPALRTITEILEFVSAWRRPQPTTAHMTKSISYLTAGSTYSFHDLMLQNSRPA